MSPFLVIGSILTQSGFGHTGAPEVRGNRALSSVLLVWGPCRGPHSTASRHSQPLWLGRLFDPICPWARAPPRLQTSPPTLCKPCPPCPPCPLGSPALSHLSASSFLALFSSSFVCCAPPLLGQPLPGCPAEWVRFSAADMGGPGPEVLPTWHITRASMLPHLKHLLARSTKQISHRHCPGACGRPTLCPLQEDWLTLQSDHSMGYAGPTRERSGPRALLCWVAQVRAHFFEDTPCTKERRRLPWLV